MPLAAMTDELSNPSFPIMRTAYRQKINNQRISRRSATASLTEGSLHCQLSLSATLLFIEEEQYARGRAGDAAHKYIGQIGLPGQDRLSGIIHILICKFFLSFTHKKTNKLI